MSALLNVIDGVGSEDGKIVFATVSDVCLIYSFSWVQSRPTTLTDLTRHL